jgi:hypothetical protein
MKKFFGTELSFVDGEEILLPPGAALINGSAVKPADPALAPNFFGQTSGVGQDGAGLTAGIIAHTTNLRTAASDSVASIGVTQNAVSVSSAASASANVALVMSAVTTGALSKLDSQLAALHLSHSSLAADAAPFTSMVQQFAGSISANGQYVVIDATAADGNGANLLGDLQQIGLIGGSSFGALASGWLPIDQIETLAGLSGLRFARESVMTTNVGLVTTQADHALTTDTARSTYGVDGAGIKVGILSDSFNKLGGYNADIASGDLPAGVQIIQDYTLAGATDEGRGMAQLVYDIAPGASLAFATAFTGQAGFANNIIALKNAGANVIVDDVIYFAEPMFQDGVIAQAVDQVTAAGAVYFSSAGNNGHKGYESAYLASTTTQTINSKPETWHNYDSASPTIFMPFTLANNRTATVILQWNQPAGSVSPGHAATSDLDLAVANSSNTLIGIAQFNNIGNDPIEVVQFSNTSGATQTYKIVVGLSSGAAPTDMKIVTFNGGGTVSNGFASNTNDGTVYGHAAATGAIAVGAASYDQTPGFGVTPPGIESFSSAGPTRIFFDTAGNPISVVRQTPQITAPDGGNTSFFGSDDGDADSFPNFYGTSAAAPAAAAVAALLLQADGSLSAAGLKTLLMNSAIDIDNPATPGFDTAFDVGTGAGLIQGGTALSMVTGSVAIDDVTITEGDNGTSVATFTVTRSGGTAAFAVNFATADNSATTADNDYAASSGTLNFGAGVNTQTISVTINGDGNVETDETFSVGLSGATNAATISDDSGTGTITNDDQSGSVSIDDVTITEGDSGTKIATFTVTRSGGTAPFAVNFATAENSATTADSDYVANSGTLNFGAGVNTQTLSVTINGDGKVETDETFSVNLSGATNAATISDNSGTGTITNDDHSGSVSINDVTITEGNAGTKIATFTATRSGGTAPFAVNFATADNSATTADSDYVANSGTLNFGAGVNTQTISVTINGDGNVETDETFSVGLSGATNAATISDDSGTGTITNDDQSGSVSIDDVTITEGDSGTKIATFTVTRSGGTAPFAINFATADGTATTADSDYVASSGTLNFAANDTTKTFTVTINGDGKVESDETFFVNLSGATNAATISDGQGIGTIQNDDISRFDSAGIWTSSGNGSDNTWHVGDFNGDGKDDIFRYLGGEDVFLSNGSSFAHSGLWSPAGNGSDGKWHVGDFNGDGKADIFRYLGGTSGADMFLSNGASFVHSGSWSPAGTGIDGTWHVGDFNGDGKADIFRYLGGEDVFLSNGSSFGNESLWSPASAGSDGKWYLGDFNGDGKTDIFRYLAGRSGADVFLSDGTKFVHDASWTGAGFGSDDTWHLGDFNGDGKTDIFRYLFGQSGADVFLSDGTKFVHDASWTGAGFGTDNQWHVGDFNGGGAADIFRQLSGADMLLSHFG